MKKILITISALAMSVGLFAQTQDSLLRRQMELHREFNPTLQDADKINSLPALPEPTVQKANTNYSTWAERVAPPLEIAIPGPGNIMTDIPFSTKRGYLMFTAGNYANFNGALGYRLVENEKHNLAFNFLHNSTNGEINYLQDVVGDGVSSNNAYMMDNKGQLTYKHLAEVLKLNMHLSYLNSRFNYYGNSFEHNRFFNDENQRLGVMNAKVGIESMPSNLINYRGFIDFKNFSTKISENPLYEWMKGNEIHAMVGLDKPFSNTNNKIGVDGSILTTIYNGEADNYFLINAAPYLYFGGLNHHAKLGADILFQNAEKTKVRVVPNIDLRWGVTDHSSIYAKIHGGFKHNTYLDMMNESRYFLSYTPVRSAFSLIDLEAGTKIGEISGFRFDIFGGYSKTEDEHFLLLNGNDIVGGDIIAPFMESLKPIYGTLSHSYIGGMVQTNIWSPMNLSLRMKKNFYETTEVVINDINIENPEAYNKPGLEIDIKGTLELISNLKLTLNYYFAGDRWTYLNIMGSTVNSGNIKMNNINDLNLGGVYNISDSFSLNVKANNILSQKYDIWYGYPSQGINVSGGFTFMF